MSVNKAILIGNVGKDPEIRYLDKDVAVANFTMATTERGYTLQNGTVVPDRTEWHNIVAWKGLATLAEKYIKKGTQIYVEGKITTRAWEKDGVKRYTTDIVADTISLLGRKPENGSQSTNAAQTIETAPVDIQPIPPVDDDLPF
jgi:single-strand DNA-binding protein